MVPEEITASWVDSILGFNVKSIDITKVLLDQTTSKVFVTVTYEDDTSEAYKPKHLCIKGSFNPAMMEVEGYKQVLVPLYTREVEFFNRVEPKLTYLSTLKVWWAGINREQDQAILVMEDLDRQGYVFGKLLEDRPLERVKTGVEQLAALHAGTWNISLPEYSWVTPDYEDVMMGLTNLWDKLVLAPDRPPFPDFVKDRERTVAVMKRHYATKNPKFICLIHGDPHAANTYLDQKGDLHFYDWQALHAGSAFHDFAYFVISALSIKDRRKHEFSLLRHYLETLHKFGGSALSIEDPEVLEEYRKSTLAGLGWVLCPYEMHCKEEVFTMCERFCAAFEDHKPYELLESPEKLSSHI